MGFITRQEICNTDPSRNCLQFPSKSNACKCRCIDKSVTSTISIIYKCATQIIAKHANNLNLLKASVFNTLMKVQTVHPGCVWQLLQSSFHDPLHWSSLQRSKWPRFPWSSRFPALKQQKDLLCLVAVGSLPVIVWERWSSELSLCTAKYPSFLQASCGLGKHLRWDELQSCSIPVTCWHRTPKYIEVDVNGFNGCQYSILKFHTKCGK